jgi:hypothetical protein
MVFPHELFGSYIAPMSAFYVGFALLIFGSVRALKDYLDAKRAPVVSSANMPYEPKVRGDWKGLLVVGGIAIVVPIFYVVKSLKDSLALFFILPISTLFVLMGIIFVVRGVYVKINSGK